MATYILSRNFRLQRVSDIDSILTKCRIREVSLGFPTSPVMGRTGSDSVAGSECSSRNASSPVTVGWRHSSLGEAARLFGVGECKVRSGITDYDQSKLSAETAGRFAAQALIAGIDVCRQPLEVGHPRASSSSATRNAQSPSALVTSCCNA